MTRRWWPLAALSLALAAGCGSSGEPPPSPSVPGTAGTTPTGTKTPTGGATLPAPAPAPRRLTAADDGSAFAMTVGSTTSLVLPATADEPLVEGDAVVLVEVVNVTDSGAREWEVRAERAGTSTVTGRSPGFVVTLVVG